MKTKIVLCSIILTLSTCLFGETLQRFYIDFGPNDVTNGNATTNPDANNNYWNNINTVRSVTALVNNNNISSNFQLAVSPTFA